jgi:hypothetical protein
MPTFWPLIIQKWPGRFYLNFANWWRPLTCTTYVKTKANHCWTSEIHPFEIWNLRGSCAPPMGVTTRSFRLSIEVVKHYVAIKFERCRYDSFWEKRGQSFDFAPKYLGSQTSGTYSERCVRRRTLIVTNGWNLNKINFVNLEKSDPKDSAVYAWTRSLYRPKKYRTESFLLWLLHTWRDRSRVKGAYVRTPTVRESRQS